MRKILFVLLLFKCYVSFSQEKFTVFFRNAVNEKVKVFFSENSHEECAEIKEDSLLENWHNVKILQKSACRYLVEIKNEQHPDLLLIKGWVKKRIAEFICEENTFRKVNFVSISINRQMMRNLRR